MPISQELQKTFIEPASWKNSRKLAIESWLKREKAVSPLKPAAIKAKNTSSTKVPPKSVEPREKSRKRSSQ